jgi:hypothetical protein
LRDVSRCDDEEKGREEEKEKERRNSLPLRWCGIE